MNDERPDPTTTPQGSERSDCCGPRRRGDAPPFERLYDHTMHLAEQADTDVERMLWTNYARELLAAREAREGERVRSAIGMDLLRSGIDQGRAFVGECVDRLRRPTMLEGASAFVGNVLEHYTGYIGMRARVKLDAAERALVEARELGRANSAAMAASEEAARKSMEFREYMESLREWWKCGASFTVRLGDFELTTRPARPERKPEPQRRWQEWCPLFPACEDDEEPEAGETWKWLPPDLDPGYIRVSRLSSGLPTLDPRHYAWQALTLDDMGRRWGNGEYLVELVSTYETDGRVIFHRIVEVDDAGPAKEFPGPDDAEGATPAAEAAAVQEPEPPSRARVTWEGCPLFPAPAEGEKVVRGKTWKFIPAGLNPSYIRLSVIEGGETKPMQRKFDWKTLTADMIVAALGLGAGEVLVELLTDDESGNRRIFHRTIIVEPLAPALAPADP